MIQRNRAYKGFRRHIATSRHLERRNILVNRMTREFLSYLHSVVILCFFFSSRPFAQTMMQLIHLWMHVRSGALSNLKAFSIRYMNHATRLLLLKRYRSNIVPRILLRAQKLKITAIVLCVLILPKVFVSQKNYTYKLFLIYSPFPPPQSKSIRTLSREW